MIPVAAGALAGESVLSANGDPIGVIEDVMLDLATGAIAFAVLAAGAERRFAVPWEALRLPDAERDFYVLDYAPAR